MADHTVGATGTYASIQAALDDGGVSSGDTLLLQSQAHSGTGNSSITSSKNITIRPVTAGTPSFSSGARIICDIDEHIFDGYTGSITLIDLAVQSNTDSGSGGFDGSNEVIRMNNAIAFTATRCKFRMTPIADGTDEGDFSQCDAAGTFVFENCEFTRFDRKIISVNFMTGVSVTMRHCFAYTPGTFYDGTNRTGTVTLNGCAIRCAVATFASHATATTTLEDCILSDNPGSFDTATNVTTSATFADTTGASAFIVEDITGEDFTIVDHANNLALDYVPEADTTVTDDLTGAARTDADHDCGCYEISSAGGGLSVTISPATLTLTPTTLGVNRHRGITVSPAGLALTPTQIGVARNRHITINPAALTLTPAALSVNRHRGITVAPAALTLTPATLDIARHRGVTVNPAALILTPTKLIVTTSGDQNITLARVKHPVRAKPLTLFLNFEMRVLGVNLLEGLKILYPAGAAFSGADVVLAESYHEIGDLGIVLGARLFAGSTVIRFWMMPIYGHTGVSAAILNRRQITVVVTHPGGGFSIDLDKPAGTGHTVLNGQPVSPTYFDWNLATNQKVGTEQLGYPVSWVSNDFFSHYPQGSGQSTTGGGMSFRYDPSIDPLTPANLYRLLGSGHAWRNPDGSVVTAHDASGVEHWFLWTHPHADNRYNRGSRWWISPLGADATHIYDGDIFPPWTHQTFGWGAAMTVLIKGTVQQRTDFGFAWLALARAQSWLANMPDKNGVYANTTATNALNGTGRHAGRVFQMGSEIRQALQELARYRTDTTEIDGLIARIDTRLAQMRDEQYNTWQSHPGNAGAGLYYNFRGSHTQWGQPDPPLPPPPGRNPGDLLSTVSWHDGHWFNGIQIYQEARVRAGLGIDAGMWLMQRKLAEEIFDQMFNWSLGHPYAAFWPPLPAYPTDPRTGSYYTARRIRWAISYATPIPLYHPGQQWRGEPNPGHTTFCIPAMEFLYYNGLKTGADKVKLDQILEDYQDVGYWWRLGTLPQTINLSRVRHAVRARTVALEAENEQTIGLARVRHAVRARELLPTLDDVTIELGRVKHPVRARDLTVIQQGEDQLIELTRVKHPVRARPVVAAHVTADVTLGKVRHGVRARAVAADAQLDVTLARVRHPVLARPVGILEQSITLGRVRHAVRARAFRRIGGAYYAFVTWTAGAGETTFGVPFQFLDPSHVDVYVNGVQLPASDFTVAPGAVALAEATGAGARVSILRRTPHYEPSFADGAPLIPSSDIQTVFLHLLYFDQEVADRQTGYTP